ncbi:Bug family tripartite tricarboxylate transporter substrate binding protein [Roseomonas xinghualingensis]|uniref:Bug family tripartite tricarboxylate transporter substrate binding protein n=1 Tax=Roseomonas xinghualingensis TaxID=2986475 RepID=UPI0021F1FD7A|nr:tripartite tricarboxylate transporter substrate binding protein [Roseomonas sp. SXEYE001]MCV4206660.1 tripartite tricarboxylate transporter substrate binding protein [Roseomonas sp. SXEYE001]
MALLTRRRSLLLAATLSGAALPRMGAHAQGTFPDRPIRVIVPFPAGGTTDMLARLFAQRMTEGLGQPVVVENRGGAGGSVGADAVAKATPDGYTLLFHNLTFSSTTAALQLANRAPHDIERDFAPVSLAANVPMLLIASKQLPVQDLREFVAYARQPQQAALFYGSTGPGSIMNLACEVLKRDAEIAMEHVPFRGAAPLVQEMVAGRIQFGGDQLSTALPHVRGGALRPIATLAAQRSPALPDVPTVREQGYPNMELRGWNGFFAPARTPEAVIARLQHAIAEAAAHPDAHRRMSEVGAEPVGSSAAELRQVVSEQMAQVRPLITELRLQVE